MRVDIVNGNIIPGDGKTVLERASVIIQDGMICEVPHVPYVSYNSSADRVIDANDGYVLPGIINIHSHGVSLGPFFPYGWKRMSKERVIANLDRHLLQGTTTVLNGDGLALPSEVDATNKLHPIHVRMATLHTPKNIRAAEITAGMGIEPWHRKMTAFEAVKLGAVALAEVGSPCTSFGTAEKCFKLGRTISPRHALALDNAVFSGTDEDIRKALKDAGIKMEVKEAREFVHSTSVAPVEAAREAILETIEYVPKLGVPTLVHAETTTKEAVLKAAKQLGPKLIAVHVNHTFTVEESVRVAEELRSYGAKVEIITADTFGAKQIEPVPDSTFAILKRGLADVITTDFSGGYHDAILLLIQKAVENKIITLPEGVAMATSAPASLIPGLAWNRGYIEEGKVADLCIVDKHDITRVNTVIIGGNIVVENGKKVYAGSIQ